jgi:hypothetical protein
MELSDGAYSWPSLIVGDIPKDGKEERFDCDRILLKMIQAGQLKPGDKIRSYGIYMFHHGMQGHDAWERLSTKHYFLSKQHECHLKINMNGFCKAAGNARLGEQPTPYFRKPISGIN